MWEASQKIWESDLPDDDDIDENWKHPVLCLIMIVINTILISASTI